MEFSLGQLIDSLITVNLKIFKFEDLKRDSSKTDKEIADACRATNDLNTSRNKLINELDKKIKKLIDSEETEELQTLNSVKSYGK